MCVGVTFVCVHAHEYLQRPEEGTGSPVVGVTVGVSCQAWVLGVSCLAWVLGVSCHARLLAAEHGGVTAGVSCHTWVLAAERGSSTRVASAHEP